MIYADDVKDAYFYLLRQGNVKDYARWDGGKDRYTGIRHANKWEKVAEFLNEHNCDDVYGFIYANLRFRTDLERAPINLQPTHLYSDTAWQAYQLFLENQKDIGKNLQTELDIFVSRYKYWKLLVGEKHALETTLKDENTSISPILRYYLARNLGFHHIADKYFRAAEYQFLPAEKTYKKYLKGIDLEGVSCKD